MHLYKEKDVVVLSEKCGHCLPAFVCLVMLFGLLWLSPRRDEEYREDEIFKLSQSQTSLNLFLTTPISSVFYLFTLSSFLNSCLLLLISLLCPKKLGNHWKKGNWEIHKPRTQMIANYYYYFFILNSVQTANMFGRRKMMKMSDGIKLICLTRWKWKK